MNKLFANDTWKWVAGALGVLILFVVLVKLGSEPRTGLALDLNITDRDWKKGAENPSVTIVEYSDFQCPACASFFPVVKQLLAAFPDDVQIVYRHFPLPQHTNATPASLAAEAAGSLGKFWEMHDQLFSKQTEWSNTANPETLFVNYAKTIGLDKSAFTDALAKKAGNDHINDDVASGRGFGVNSTPTFFLNGKKIANPRSFEEFSALVQTELGQTPTTPNPSEAKAVHEHADIAIFIENKQFDLSQAKYESSEEKQRDQHVHLHNGNGKIIHKHKEGITLGYFFKTLGMTLTNTCLALDDGNKYCTDDTNTLKVFVNGKTIEQAPSYEFLDLDRILVSFGPMTDPATASQLTTLSNDACIYSKTCPERGTPPDESCVGGLGTDCE